jgi:hypothetical protein
MIDLRHILFGQPALQKGTLLIFLGLFVLFPGVMLLLLTHADYCWGLIVLGAFIGCAGGFRLSQPEGKSV